VNEIVEFGVLAPTWRAWRQPDPTHLGRPWLRWLVYRRTDRVTTDLWAIGGHERISVHWTYGAALREARRLTEVTK
jgi:hypothetical protein